MEKKPDVNSLYYTICDRKYILDFVKLKEMCLSISNNDTREKEITEEYTLGERDSALKLTSKIDHEIKSNNMLQNDVVLYDTIKMFIDRIMDVDSAITDYGDIDSGLSLALNSLIACGILKEIK